LSCVAVSAHHDLGAADAPALTEPRLRFAHALGAKILITNATSADIHEALMRNLDIVIPVCEETGVLLALENPGHGKGAVIGSATDGVRLIERIGSPFVRLNYDVGNILTYSREALRPEFDFKAALPAAAHMHFKDIGPTADGWRFTAIGEGAIDYRAIWRKLEDMEPDLPIGLELPLRLARPDWGDPKRAASPLPLETLRAALRRSLDFLARVEDET
jgi:sugar phosphate isomerase/epimerase